jgi:hypothetical protein
VVPKNTKIEKIKKKREIFLIPYLISKILITINTKEMMNKNQ